MLQYGNPTVGDEEHVIHWRESRALRRAVQMAQFKDQSSDCGSGPMGL